ncbi:unnamed protein product (macronuclear) [Paramecium tetraurelia]|uniref:RanBD1 domain-containing protein n=1 Tax=Paramecium tetraurelia TaxID=5888 RepID=A0CLC5_PARTE|nr:uncharacterized protein GSPATT00008140001 [Paramecium tetraurelia]CAK71592.1 unnamed protein product [Paramecium tetraurelia]|eukprot:XP_001438989.1 hypothetical protein (macronuclear) [Paramecium tetraurelia strain d4-2]
MNQSKVLRVDIVDQKNHQAIMEMPKDYRKEHFIIRKNEIRIKKEEVQPPKKMQRFILCCRDADQYNTKEYYQQRKKNMLIIRDDREKQPYQTQSLILLKCKGKYSLSFVSQKSEVYKHVFQLTQLKISEEFQNKLFKDIDKGLDARKNQENRDKVDIREKKQIAEYKNDLSDSDEEDSFSNKKNQVEKNKQRKNITQT